MAIIPIAPALPHIVPIAPNYNKFSSNAEVYSPLASSAGRPIPPTLSRVLPSNNVSAHMSYGSPNKPILPVIRPSSSKDNQGTSLQGPVVYGNNGIQPLTKGEPPIAPEPYLGPSASPSPTSLMPSGQHFGPIQNSHISSTSQHIYPQLGVAGNGGILSQSPIGYNAPPSSDSISVSKDWVLPPRPKPGRKPASDVPPTKRKAQNRAAQRAFRERRAAKVSELEEKLTEVEQEHDDKVQDLSSRLNSANAEIERLNKLLDGLKNKVSSPNSNDFSLDGPVPPEQGEKGKNSGQCCSSHKHGGNLESITANGTNEISLKTDDDCGLCDKGESCVCDTLGFKASSKSFSDGDAINRLSSGNFENIDNISFEREISLMEPMAAVPLKKRPANKSTKNSAIKRFKRLTDTDSSLHSISSPSSTPVSFSLSISRDGNEAGSVTDDSERSPVRMDHKSTNGPPLELEFSRNSKVSPVVDPCGFCSDGTPCLCAEAAENSEASFFSEPVNQNSEAAEVRSVSSLEPLASTHAKPDIVHEFKGDDSSLLSSAGRLVKNSASCSRCQDDPMCTLFCTSLETYYNEKGYKTFRSSTSSSGKYISCEAAYKTISRHKAFLSSELGDILSKLESGPDSFDVDDNGTLKINVSSVAQVLKDLSAV